MALVPLTIKWKYKKFQEFTECPACGQSQFRYKYSDGWVYFDSEVEFRRGWFGPIIYREETRMAPYMQVRCDNCSRVWCNKTKDFDYERNEFKV